MMVDIPEMNEDQVDLVKRAANAAGLHLLVMDGDHWDCPRGPFYIYDESKGGNSLVPVRPLTDDGDMMKFAIAFGLEKVAPTMAHVAKQCEGLSPAAIHKGVRWSVLQFMARINVEMQG